jgi:dolichol-phosphate mannosyltransferase
MTKALVIVPTYNEADNVEHLIDEVLKQSPMLEMLIVDDNSPDGTAAIVRRIQETNPKVHMLQRPGKMGLGTAYVVGFKYAIEHGYDFAFEMDADFSHNPEKLPVMLEAMNHCDLVIGSRYISGVNVVNWPLKRLLLSYFANIYTRIITGMPVHDATAGFKCYRRAVLESMNLDAIISNGYAFQIETNFRAWKKGFTLKEIPITFVDRRVGVSKMSKSIVYEAVFMVWKLKFLSIFNRL